MPKGKIWDASSQTWVELDAKDADTVDGKHASQLVQTTYNSTLNSDSRNSNGVTRLFRSDSNTNYSVQTKYENTYVGSLWTLKGYNGDSYHSDCYVGHAGDADTLDGKHASDFMLASASTGDIRGTTLDFISDSGSAVATDASTTLWTLSGPVFILGGYISFGGTTSYSSAGWKVYLDGVFVIGRSQGSIAAEDLQIPQLYLNSGQTLRVDYYCWSNSDGGSSGYVFWIAT